MNALHLPNAEFRSLAARVTDIAADLLAGLDDMRAFPAVRGEQVARAFEAPLPEEGLRAGALACFVNHRTTDQDVGQIVPEVLEAAREVLSG